MFVIIGSLGLATVMSLLTPLLQYFRFLYLIPVLCLLIALGSAKFHRVKLGSSRFVGKWLVLTGFLAFSFAYLLIPNFHREDWKSLTKSLPRKPEIYMITSSADPIKYYKSDLKIKDLKNIPKKINKKEFFVLPYTADIHGVNYRKRLAEQKFSLVEKKAYRGIILERWRRYNAM